MPIEERHYLIILAVLELILGVVTIIMAVNIYNLSAAFGDMLREMKKYPYMPAFVIDMYEAIYWVLLLSGIFIIIHGIKRIIDNLMKPFVVK